jgi:hypothetical protein
MLSSAGGGAKGGGGKAKFSQFAVSMKGEEKVRQLLPDMLCATLQPTSLRGWPLSASRGNPQTMKYKLQYTEVYCFSVRDCFVPRNDDLLKAVFHRQV